MKKVLTGANLALVELKKGVSKIFLFISGPITMQIVLLGPP